MALSDNTRWGLSLINLTSIVPPGSDATFNFTVTAPAAGSYNFQWRMVQQGVERFGALTTNVTVQTVNNPPAVSLTSPAQNATFTAPATVAFAATASDSDGTITKVEFFQGSTKVGEDTTSPYTFNWTNVAAGSYVLTARATDNGGATTDSSAVNITVNPPNQPPTVTLTTPTAGQVFSAPANITITANAADSDGIVTKVQFFHGTTLLNEDTSAPFSFNWNNVAAGNYSLTAKAFDNAGATTTSAAIAITVNVLPSVSLTAPSSGQVFTAPASITLTATASDSDGSISKVQFFHGTTLLNEDTSAPYSFNWTNVAAGNYSLTAKAFDNLGGTTTSAAIPITVNSLPTVSITSPSNPTTFVAPANITITASASDADGSITKVEFFAGTSLLGEDTTAPYTFAYNNVSSGTYVLTARATDNLGGVTTSSLVSAIVTNAPTTSITSPANNAAFMDGSNIIINASASDSDGTIAKVEFFKNGVLLGEDTTSPYSFTWNTVPIGTYSLTTRATDNLGITATSAAITVNVVATGEARLDPMNQTGGGGENPLSQNFNWNLPFLNLPGRAGLNLGLTLSYNSLVWTKNGTVISFDDDKGFPSPGFRLGFPVIQQPYFNNEVQKDAYLLIKADGSRIELRRVTTTLFESADSSHLLLDTDTMTLRTTDGTQLSYVLKGSVFQCTQIKDRNGNFITIDYTQSGQIGRIIDTLGRQINFIYDAGLLSSIRQTWKQESQNPLTHEWATFVYNDTEIQTHFDGLTILGTSNGAFIKTLSKVTLADGTNYQFSYTSWGQVWKVSGFSGTQLLNYRSYNLPQDNQPLLADCPRFTQRRDWARYWNGDTDGTGNDAEAALTSYLAPAPATWTMPDGNEKTGKRVEITFPDGTVNKIYFIGPATNVPGWQRGLPALVDTYNGGPDPVRRSMTTWTQDNPSVSYLLNPRVTETNVYDAANNRARTEITYQQFTLPGQLSCHLPVDVFEYAADGETKLRTTHTIYNESVDYTSTSRRILGLVSERHVYEGGLTGTLKAKVAFFYDNENNADSIDGTDAPIQHDSEHYPAGFVTGRANLSSVVRYNVEVSGSTTTRTTYNRAGAVVLSRDASSHEVKISYADSFSDGTLRSTFAYPTKVTDPALFSSTAKYNFDFGGVTYRQTPKPNQTKLIL